MQTRDLEEAEESDLDKPQPSAPGKQPAKEETPKLQPIQRPWRATAIAMVGMFILALFYTFYFAADFFLPLTLAWILNLLLKPAVRGLKRFHIPEAVGAAILLLGFIGVLIASIFWVSQPASEMLAKAPETLQAASEKIRGVIRPAQSFKRAAEEVEKFSAPTGEDDQPMQQVEVKKPGLMNSVLSKTTNIAFLLGETLVLLYFLLVAGDLLVLKAIQALPRFGDKKRAVEILNQTQQQVSRYLGSITIINIIEGTLIGIGLAIVGMPNPILWGVVAALVNYIPYLGAMTCVACISIVSLVTFPTLGQALLPPAIYLGVNMTDNFLAPFILGKRMVLNPLIVFLALMFWGWIWGIVGVLLAVPLTMTFKIFCDHFKTLAPVGEMLAGETSEPKAEAKA